MKRGAPLKRSRLRSVSDKRRHEAADRRAVLDRVRDRDGPGCYAQQVIDEKRRVVGPEFDAVVHPPACGGPLDGHEVIPRSTWIGGHLVDSNVRLVCRIHHDWVHAHPVTAATLGLLSHGWEQ